MGWLQPLGSRWYAAGEVLGGAAGGGGVDSRGAIAQAIAHVGYQVTPAFSLRGSVGRVEALRGPLGSNVVGVSANFTYGVSAGS